MALRKLPAAFVLTSSKSWYPHLFNTVANLNYVGSIPDMQLYGVTEMSESERKEFTAWYDAQKGKVFDNRRVLEDYCHDFVTVLRQACQIFRRDFKEVGHVDIFLESCTIASACNKVLRKRFLKPNTIGLIPTGGYTCNSNYSKKALMWLLHMEQTDRYTIMHARTVANTDYRNCLALVSTVIAYRHAQYMNFSVAITTGASASPSVNLKKRW